MVRESRSKVARELNRHVGRRISACRVAAGLQLVGLAARTSIPVRALRRIEAGHREADVGQLLAIAQALGLPVAALFEGLAARRRAARKPAQSPERLGEVEALVNVYRRIGDAEQRRRIVSLLKACAESGSY